MTVMLGDKPSFMPPRRLRVLAFDPATGNRFLNRGIRTITITLPWEFDPSNPNAPFLGPRGEYLEVVDHDPASGVFYDPLDLNDQRVLLNDGVAPSEEDPKFHQQMVYAVAMETIHLFEQALGRVVLWSPRVIRDDAGRWERFFVRRLRIYPHAIREANAYYDPRKKALLFGYFTAGDESRAAPPGTTVFTCLSHDVIVHETCHAILDGLHPRFAEASHPDMPALHEAFSDLVALFQQFSHPEVLADQISRTRGDLEQQSLLASLAQEFGEAIGRGGALRDALGGVVDGVWTPRTPDNRALDDAHGPHARGSVLVAAVFRAFLTIYQSRVADLFRIASGGAGILPPGAIDPDLVGRLAKEAAHSARHVLQICIRAMDYCPPVAVSFGDYLRAIITADHDLYPEDEKGYRAAFIEAFTAWGIRPEDMPIVTERALLWPSMGDIVQESIRLNAVSVRDVTDFNVLLHGLAQRLSQPFASIDELAATKNMKGWFVDGLRRRIREILDTLNTRMDARTGGWDTGSKTVQHDMDTPINLNLLELDLRADRHFAYMVQEFYAQLFWGIVSQWPDPMLNMLGIATSNAGRQSLRLSSITGKPTFHVFSVRIARRLGKRGQQELEYVVELIQSRDGYLDRSLQEKVDRLGHRKAADLLVDEFENAEGRVASADEAEAIRAQTRRDFRYRAGCMLLIDARTFQIRRVIRTGHMADDDRGLEKMRRHLDKASEQAMNAFDAPEGTGDPARAFAMLHRHTDAGGHGWHG